MALTLFALAVLALAATWAFNRSDPSPTGFDIGQIAASLFLTAILAEAAKTFLKPLEQTPAVIGLAIGALIALMGAYADRFKSPGIVALAMGCMVSSYLLLAGKPHLDVICLAIVAGAGASAALYGNRTASLVSLSASAVAFVHLLAHTKEATAAVDYGGAIGIGVFTVFALLGLVLKGLRQKSVVWPILAGFAGVVAIAVIAKYCFPDVSDWYGLLTVPVISLVIFWLQHNNSERPKFSLALSTIMWIGLSTIAFGIQRGLGIGIAFLVSTGVLLLMDAERTLLSSGPLFALVLHGAFRLEHPDVGGVIDIGQHYALVGFALAAILPLLPIEWLKLHGTLSSSLKTASGLIWLVICFATPCLIALFLAPKGLLGFVTGLGFCGFFAWLDQEGGASVLALAGALGAASILEYGSVENFTDLTRDDKIHWFLITALVLAVVAGVLAVISSFKSRAPAAEAA